MAKHHRRGKSKSIRQPPKQAAQETVTLGKPCTRNDLPAECRYSIAKFCSRLNLCYQLLQGLQRCIHAPGKKNLSNMDQAIIQKQFHA